MNNSPTFPIDYLKVFHNIVPKAAIKFYYSRFGIIFSKTIFSCLQLLNYFFLSPVIALTPLSKIIKLQCFYKQYSEMFKTLLNNVCDCHDLQGIKFITQQRLGFNHLQKHEFKCNFPDSLNPMCNYCRDVESTSYFLF